jgi:hypothetical protein
MAPKVRRGIIAMLISAIFTILLMEIALDTFDPWGMHYFDDLATIWDHVVWHPNRVTVLPAGDYRLSNWSVTQLDDNTRYVPDNQNGPCKIVFVGDSLTWGHGVNDNETWVNLLARDLPEATVINAGFDGYNSENVRGTLLDYPDADIFVYFIMGNDAEPTNPVFRMTRVSMLKKYYTYIKNQYFTHDQSSATDEVGPQLPPNTPDTIRFEADIAAMAKDDRISFFGFDAVLTQLLLGDYKVTILLPYKHRISKADAHPNPRGHEEIRLAILPHIHAAAAANCGPE